MRHVAVVHRKYAELILSGQKTAELRLTKNRVAPYGRVQRGDRVFIKIASGPVCCCARVRLVEQYEDLSPAEIARLRSKLNEAVMGENAYWELKRTARYATVMHLADVQPCDEAPGYAEARAGNPRSAWLVLEG
ncbi:MAG: ASCH domain-containing protein [Phycisphaerales bacterium JB058]